MEKLTEVLRIQSVSGNQKLMHDYLINEVGSIDGCKITKGKGNIYVTKGTGPYPCVISHMDTVHPIVEDLTVLQFGNKLTGFNTVSMKQTGIGGDDKVGIFITLECLKQFDNIKVAFFRDEEIGCVGSYKANMNFFKDCCYVLQCDRKGNGDFITDASGVELSNEKFQDAIQPTLFNYGYKFEHGMMTDVMALKKRGLGVCCANMSCGYYNPHQSNEYVNINDVAVCLSMVFDLIVTLGDTVYEHTYKRVEYPAGNNLSWFMKPIKPKRDLRSPSFTLDEDDVVDSQRFNFSDNMCNDCWYRPAVKNGLCRECSEYHDALTERLYKERHPVNFSERGAI